MTWITLRRLMYVDANDLVERWALVIMFESGGYFSYVSANREDCITELETIYG